MKLLRLVALGISISLLAMSPAMSAAKVGGYCKKVGATSSSKGKPLICVKAGKKLVWQRVVVEKPVAVPTAPPATFPKEPKTLAEITSYDQVTYWAWRKSSDIIKANESYVKEVEVLIGPNSGILNKNPLVATQITSRLYAGFAQPKKLRFISYSFADLAWAQNLIETSINDEALLNLIQSPNRGGKENARNTCPSAERCHSSQPFTNRAGESIVIAGYTASMLNNEEVTEGLLQSHEYTHVIQKHQFIGSVRELEGLASLKQFAPWWLVEGGADFGGFASKHYLSYETYLRARMRDVIRSPKMDANWYQEFINPESNQYWIRFDPSGEIYNVGFMITEILSAIKGPGVQMELFKQFAAGKSMDEAFESIFNVSWKSAVVQLATLISTERSKYG